MRSLTNILWVVMLCLFQVKAFAAFDMELTKGTDSAIPIAIAPFADGMEGPENMTAIIAQDLQNSGRFEVLNQNLISQKPHQISQVDYQYWIDKNVDDLVIGHIQSLGGNRYQISFSLLDLFKNQSKANVNNSTDTKNAVLATQEFSVEAKDMRRLAHHISDIIYEQLTGDKGVFSTKLAYVLAERKGKGDPTYYLVIADADGFNALPILRSSEPIMSPSWSPDGKRIAYVSFEGKRPKVYVSDVATGHRELVTSFPGINGAPSWSPNGQQLAVALSKGANPNIYTIDLATKQTRQLTSDLAINTEPSWAPDGRSLIFTSDRGGSPQIYKLSLDDNRIERLTFEGNYNATASFSPDGKNIVMLHREGSKQFTISILELHTGTMRHLTAPGLNESPSVAPNGKMVVYASHYGGQGVLGMVSTDGRVRLRIPEQQGNVQEPVWSPFL